MFVSDKFNLVFYEVPRTGSNSVTKALEQLDPEAPTVVKRASTNPLLDYHYFAVPEKEGKPYLIFACHRNPYHRLWSFWKHRHYRGDPAVFRATSWPRYVKWVCDPSSVPEIKGVMLDIPISEMFDCDQVTFWLRFDSLVDSWHEFGQFSQIDLPAIGAENASPYMGEFRQSYNQKTAAMVAERFAQDFARFGYDVDSWKT